MRSVVALVGLAVMTHLCMPSRVVEASGGPSVVITSPRSGAVIKGGVVTMRVSVSNFKLVEPVLKNPPILKGNAGNVEYILDSPTNFVPTRDLSRSLSHTWTHVHPGRHALIAVLVTSQHVPWPGAKKAEVMVLVPALPTRHAGGSRSPGVGAAPSTGGASDINQPGLNVSLLLAGILALILGLAFLTRRFTLGTFAGRHAGAAGDGTMQFGSSPSTPSQRDERTVAEQESDQSPAAVEHVAPPDTAPDSRIDEPIAAQGLEAGESEPLLPAGVQQADTDAAKPLAIGATAETARDRAIEMARQWSTVVEGLVWQIDEQDADRRRMLDRIRVLEEQLRTSESLHAQLRDLAISSEDFQAVRYVTESLQRDPDHIVVLAAVAQHADRLQRLVESYAQLRKALETL